MGKGKAPAANGPSNKEGVKSGIHHDFRGTEYSKVHLPKNG